MMNRTLAERFCEKYRVPAARFEQAMLSRCLYPPARLLRSPLAEVKSFDGVKYVAEDSSWLMLRGSGTEPVLRIYAEARTEAGMRSLLKRGVGLTQGKIS